MKMKQAETEKLILLITAMLVCASARAGFSGGSETACIEHSTIAVTRMRIGVFLKGAPLLSYGGV